MKPLQQRKLLHLSPPQHIAIGFALMILTGGILLNLPIASQSGESIGFLNALFTATSANCVTGLIVVNTMSHWTLFGKIVIITLIQLGGLGFITLITVALMVTRRQISLRSRRVIQAAFNQDGIGGMVKFIKNVLLVTLFFEALGALILTITFITRYSMPVGEAFAQGVFHSISAFCNAGFDNLSQSSLVPYQTSEPINFTIMALIVAGGIGFPVWIEMGRLVHNPNKKSLRFRMQHISLHAKMVFIITGILIFSGAALFCLLEWTNPKTFGELSTWDKIQASLFQSITLRTAGFNSVPQDGLTQTSQFISSVLMVIGGSPAGAAGGMKTVTIGVVIFSLIATLRGRNKISAFERSFPLDVLQKALTVITSMLIVVFAATLILHFTEVNSPFPHGFLDLLFEVSSAAGTVGVTTGITPYLSAAGKIVILTTMYLGRIGPITLVMALNARQPNVMDDVEFPTEQVIIG